MTTEERREKERQRRGGGGRNHENFAKQTYLFLVMGERGGTACGPGKGNLMVATLLSLRFAVVWGIGLLYSAETSGYWAILADFQ